MIALLLDDCFEDCAYRLNLLEKYNRTMETLLYRPENIFIFITISKNVLKKLESSKSNWLAQFRLTIDLTDKLSVFEKGTILREYGLFIVADKFHLNVGQIIKENRTNDLDAQDNIGFPLVASITAKIDTLYDVGFAFFNAPLIHVWESVQKLVKDPMAKKTYGALMYAVMKGGQFNPNSIDTRLKSAIDELLKIVLPSTNLHTDYFLLQEKQIWSG